MPAKASPDDYKNVFSDPGEMGDIGFYSNIIENHDEPEVSAIISRKARSVMPARASGCHVFPDERSSFYLSGAGDRHGKSGVVPLDQVDDISALDQYQVSLDAGLTPKKL